jgi:competence protein ComEC
MRRSYGLNGQRSWHHLGDGEVAFLAAGAVVGEVAGMRVAPAAAIVAVVVCRRWWPVMLSVLLVCAGAALAARSWASSAPRSLGPFTGWAVVAADPVPQGAGVRVTLKVQGERFETVVYGGARTAMLRRQTGENIWVQGVRTPGGDNRARVRHVVGRFRLQVAGDVLPGNRLAVAGNRVRSALRRSAEQSMGDAEAALFPGLVIGDDARQPSWMIAQFRRSGLSHLTAVSGQNVGFVLAAALPLLRRLRTWWRWVATVALIGWFMAITRFEPSVLRAGVMAMFAATAFALGRQPRPIRLVSLAVVVLVLLDPMLVRSVGFWLSVGATVGVCLVGPWCAARLPGPNWLRLSVGVTLGAQVGVALPSMLVFHRLALVSVPANLAAVPVAGFVMLFGIPAGLLGAMVPARWCRVVMLPASVGTRWTETVAAVAAAAEPDGVAALVGWVLVLLTLAILLVRGHRSRDGHRRVPF